MGTKTKPQKTTRTKVSTKNRQRAEKSAHAQTSDPSMLAAEDLDATAGGWTVGGTHIPNPIKDVANRLGLRNRQGFEVVRPNNGRPPPPPRQQTGSYVEAMRNPNLDYRPPSPSNGSPTPSVYEQPRLTRR